MVWISARTLELSKLIFPFSSFPSAPWDVDMGGTSVGYDVLERILDRSEKPNHLPLPILARITDDFSDERKIGEGGFGVVYKVKYFFQIRSRAWS